MVRRVSKSWFVNLLSAFVLLAFTLSPCNCFAEETDTTHNTNKNSHPCCDDEKSNSDKQHDGCDNCDGCITSSSCYSDFGQKDAVQNLSQFNVEHSAKLLIAVWLPSVVESTNRIISSIGPPGFRVTSSTTLSTLLQRWLI